MAHHKSAKKRIRQTERKRMRNRNIRTNLRSTIRNLEKALEVKDTEQARGLLNETVSTIDRAASKGVIHKNKASRHVSRLTTKVKNLLAPPAA